MENEAVLLKIKRIFDKDESVKALLKNISDLRFHNGVLISEVAELKHNIETSVKKENTQGGKTKKQWLETEIIKQLNNEIVTYRKKYTEARQKSEVWQNKYFNLLAQNGKESNNY